MLSEIVINVIGSAVLLVFGYFGGQYRERRARQGKNLEEYEFYPFALDEDKNLYFDLDRFRSGVGFFLKHRNFFAARQLILVGELVLHEHPSHR